MKRISFKARAKTWVLDECNVREDVANALPDGWKLRVFKVTSPDSGNVYWVQAINEPDAPVGSDSMFCNCPHGLFLSPLQTVIRPSNNLDLICKHANVVMDFLKGGG